MLVNGGKSDEEASRDEAAYLLADHAHAFCLCSSMIGLPSLFV